MVHPRFRGQARYDDGSIIEVDIEAQCRSCFDNVRAVLEDAGAEWSDLVDVLVFLTNMERDFAVYNRIYAEYFAGEGNPNPTRTTIEINCLPTPDRSRGEGRRLRGRLNSVRRVGAKHAADGEPSKPMSFMGWAMSSYRPSGTSVSRSVSGSPWRVQGIVRGQAVPCSR